MCQAWRNARIFNELRQIRFPQSELGKRLVWEKVLEFLLMVLFCFTAFTIVVMIAMYAGPMVP
jgi:Fe2+ transport system protein B